MCAAIWENRIWFFSVSLISHLPSCCLAELLAVSVRPSRPSEAQSGVFSWWSAWLITEHKFFEVWIWSKLPAKAWPAEEKNGNYYKRIVLPVFLLCLENWTSVFTSLLLGKFKSVSISAVRFPGDLMLIDGLSRIVSVYWKSSLISLVFMHK